MKNSKLKQLFYWFTCMVEMKMKMFTYYKFSNDHTAPKRWCLD